MEKNSLQPVVGPLKQSSDRQGRPSVPDSGDPPRGTGHDQNQVMKAAEADIADHFVKAKKT